MNKWIPALKITGIGFYIATCIVGGLFIGWWLGDKKPLFMIIGLVAGLILAVYGVYHMLKPLIDEKNDKENG